MKGPRGFTFVEIIVVVAVLGIIASIVLVNLSTAAKKGRDGDRQGDLRTLQSAIELYKQKYGRYPDGCRGAGTWSGQTGTAYACASGNQYIVGLAPEFIPSLPTDKRLNGANSGYVYTTNSSGTVYKIMAKQTVESELVNYSDPFKSCDATDSSTGICDATITSGASKPNHCYENSPIFQSTYALWGGFANGAAGFLVGSVEHNTELIICDIP